MYGQPILQCAVARYEVSFRSNKDDVVKPKSSVYRNDHMLRCNLGISLYEQYKASKTEICGTW